MPLCPVVPHRLVRLLVAFALFSVLLPLPPVLAQTAPTPYGSAPITVSPTATTRVEAENYDKGGEGVAYHDVDNGGSAIYRTDNVGVYNDYNASGGYGIGWTAAGEWDGYTLSVAQAGSYALTARLGNGSSGGTFHLEFGPIGQVGGVVSSATFTAPYTGGYGSYQDVTVPAVSLPAGTLWMRLVMDSAYPCNFDFFRITPVTAAPSVTGLSFSPSPVAGGGSVGASVTLSGPAPVGGTPVTLASDNPAAVPVPGSMTVPAGSNSGYFSLVAGAVTAQTTAHVTASGGGGTASAALTVSPSASLLSFYCYSPVPGGQSAYGYLTLNGPAPAGGLTVTLSSDNAAASVPASVTVPAGNNFASVPISTTVVSTQTTANLQATAGGVTQTCALTVSPFGLSYLSLSPDSLHGGESSTGYLGLNGPAPTGGVSVTLRSDNAAATVPTSVSIPAGGYGASFSVTTTAVSTLTTATLTASGAGSPLTAPLTINPPSTPTNLTASAIATGPGTVLVNLSWTAGAGATGYSLERSQDAQSWAQIATPTGTTYQDVSAAAGASYYYRVKAANGSGYSNVASVSTALPYLVATDLEWTPGVPVVGDHVHFYAVIQNLGTAPSNPFTWNVEFEGDPGETGYNIEANPLAPGDTLLVTPPWGNFWTATGGMHHIDVVINNSYVSLSKTLVVAPSAPANLSATSALGGGIDLSWSASSGATSYNLYRGAAGAETLYKSGLTGTAFQDAGLTAGQTYYYKVSAVAGGLEGPLSNEASAMPGAGTGAGSVSGLDLGFEYPYLGTDITSYVVNPPGTPWTFTGSAGISGNSTYITYGNPAAPEGVQVGFVQGTSSLSQPLTSSSAGAWTVTFSAAQRGNVFNGGQTVQVLLDTTVLGTVTPAGTSYSDYTVGPVTLSAGSHTLSFVGTNPHGGDNMALLDNVRIHIAAPPQVPPIPTGLTATAVSGSEIDLSWVAAPGATSYNLYRNTTSGTEVLVWPGLTGTSYADPGRTAGQTYYYQVTAVNSVGESGRSSEASATPGSPSLHAPLIKAIAGNAQVSVYWSSVPGATSYNVYRTTGTGTALTMTFAGQTGSSFTDTGLANGTQYNYRVAAVSKDGQGTFSATASATPGSTPLHAPTLTATAGTNSVSLSCTGAYAYYLPYNYYRSTSPGGEGMTPIGTSDNGGNYQDTTVVSGVTYYYKAAAVGAAGEGTLSNEASAQPVFTITGSPAGVSIPQGGSGVMNISTDSTSPVTLSVSGVPSGVTGWFLQNPMTSGNGSPAFSNVGTSVFFCVGTGVSTGSYPLTFTGTSGTLSKTVTLTLTVTAPP